MAGSTNPSETYFDKGLWGHDGTQWRKLNLLWGYYDRWFEDLGNADAPAGTYSKNCAAVPAGYVYKLEGVAFMNATGARGQAQITANVGGATAFLWIAGAPAALINYTWGTPLTLKAGDYVQVIQYNVIVHDALYAWVWGYKMTVT